MQTESKHKLPLTTNIVNYIKKNMIILYQQYLKNIHTNITTTDKAEQSKSSVQGSCHPTRQTTRYNRINHNNGFKAPLLS